MFIPLCTGEKGFSYLVEKPPRSTNSKSAYPLFPFSAYSLCGVWSAVVTRERRYCMTWQYCPLFSYDAIFPRGDCELKVVFVLGMPVHENVLVSKIGGTL